MKLIYKTNANPISCVEILLYTEAHMVEPGTIEQSHKNIQDQSKCNLTTCLEVQTSEIFYGPSDFLRYGRILERDTSRNEILQLRHFES